MTQKTTLEYDSDLSLAADYMNRQVALRWANYKEARLLAAKHYNVNPDDLQQYARRNNTKKLYK